MARSTGIAAQKSRFAILDIESDSGSSEDEWRVVKNSQHGAVQSHHKGAKGGHQGPTTSNADKPMSKSAKKRARKRRNRNSSSSETTEKRADDATTTGPSSGGLVSHEPQQGAEWKDEMKRRNDEASDLEFHHQLQQALMMSRLEAERESEMIKQVKAAEQLTKSIKTNKKGVTLSLQQLHSSTGPHGVKTSKTPVNSSAGLCDFDDGPVFSPDPPSASHDPFTKLHNQPLRSPDLSSKSHDQPLKSPDSLFFDRLDEEVKSELKKDTRKPERKVNGLSLPDAAEAPRIAHLQDEIEKRDKVIERLIKDNKTLKESLKEVKERNQSLCKIMGQGEFSDKASLLQQIEELSSTKDDLTQEIGSLQVSLEQERTKNKAMKNELTKFQSMKGLKPTKTGN